MTHKHVQQQLVHANIEHDASAAACREYATDESVFEVTPQLIVFPKNTQELQAVVRIVSEMDENGGEISLTPRAAGTGLSGGSLNDSVIIDTAKYLTGISAIEKNEDGTARVRVKPGTMFRDFDAYTRKEGFFLPPYPSSRDICTVGGMVGNNAAGPNSLKYGHTASFVHELTVVLADGGEYQLTPLSYSELQAELKRTDILGRIYREVWKLIEEQYEAIQQARPQSSKNSSGYLLWEVVHAESLKAFKEGRGHFHLAPLFAGSQGTLGIISDITFTVLPTPVQSDLVVIPITELKHIGGAVQSILKFNPYNVEIFDARTYNLALKHLYFFRLQFFKDDWLAWFAFVARFLFNHVFNFSFSVPAFILLVKFDGHDHSQANHNCDPVCDAVKEFNCQAWRVKGRGMEDMFWKLRHASYSLAKLGADDKRPAAFLEDMVVPPENLPEFLVELERLLGTYKAEYAMHGHGGNGHFHFYPLMDFTDTETPQKIKTMADDFFELAKKHGGNICGEHNDGIIRTPYMSQIFSSSALELFKKLEHIFDPFDIFNPGKKVNPKFDIAQCIRKRN